MANCRNPMPWFLLALAILCTGPVQPARAEDPDPPSPAEVEEYTGVDHCHSAVDPYLVALEKRRFFNAIGKDNELTKDEFHTNRGPTIHSPFARRFDRYSSMLAFDADGNGRIDWTEADAYRRDLRKRVLAAYDANKDGRLRGLERRQANLALEAGTIPMASPSNPDTPSGPLGKDGEQFDPDAELLARYDENRDGLLSEAEIEAAMKDLRERRRAERQARLDANKDGTVDAAERDQGNGQATWGQQHHQWQLKLFDENGDGQLDETEAELAKDFQKQFQSLGRIFEMRVKDINGDGTISEQEESIVRKEFMVVGMRMGLRMRSYTDTNADGTVSAEEERQWNQRFAKGTFGWLGGFAASYDIDGNDRFDESERKQLLGGMESELQRRLATHDANNDGRTDPFEVEHMMVEFMQDVGVAPATEEPEQESPSDDASR